MPTDHAFLTLLDLSPDRFTRLLERADDGRRGSGFSSGLEDQKLILLFEKPSTRTRVSFEVGITELGGHPVTLTADQIQLSRGEPIRDTARVLSGYADGLVARVYNHSSLEECVQFGSIPVINALSDRTHPCQGFSDFLTIRTHFDLASVTVAFIGDGNNVCHSLINGTALSGASLRIATPERHAPSDEVIENARTVARETGAEIHWTADPEEAANDADVLYTDVWTSMGDEEQADERREVFAGYQIDRDLLNRAADRAVVMHCLPAHRGEEITEAVLESERSIVWQQAENRLHAQKALLEDLFGDNR